MMRKGETKSGAPTGVGHSDLRDLLPRFRELGELETIEGAHWNTEIGALSQMVAARFPGSSPALLFDCIPDYAPGFRILSGASNSFRRFAEIFGLPQPASELDLVRSYKERLARQFEMQPPVTIEGGPILENVLRDQEVDVLKFPAPFIHEQDGGRYLGTEDLVILRDPEGGWVNLGTYRIMVHSANEVGMQISPGKNGRMIREKYFSRGEDCPVLVSCGQDPLLFLASNAESPYGTSEYDVAGGHRGRPYEVVSSELHGLPMPAGAEIVLEGEISATETRREGPFGEFMGYYASQARDQPLVRVRRIYHRNDPILSLAIPSRPPSNFTFARSAVKSAMIWDQVERAGLSGVRGVWCHEAGAGRMFNVISIEQKYAGHATQAGMLAASCLAGNYAGRWVVVVDEDIDPANIFDVVWAMSTRCDPPADIDYIHNAWSTPLDPLLREPPWQNNRAVVNACRPFGWRDDFPEVAECSPEIKAQMLAKWPHLFSR